MDSQWSPVRNEIVTQTTTAAVILRSRSDTQTTARKQFIIQNVSANAADIVYILVGNGIASATNYTKRLKQDEFYAEYSVEGYECWQGPISAVCATANGSLSINER